MIITYKYLFYRVIDSATVFYAFDLVWKVPALYHDLSVKRKLVFQVH